MHRQHTMPFGAEVLESGAIVFQLWAPTADSVELCLYEKGREMLLPLEYEADGWFRLETKRAQPGALYHYRINRSDKVPDPASRFQPQGVHGPSQVIDPRAWKWQDYDWRGRPWEEAIIYELHVGTFTPEGSFAGVINRLDYLRDLGVTLIELMPVACFPGFRNWGYDGVLPFATAASHGTPNDLKRLVQEAHARGLQVILDVVYNHFGPEGNVLPLYAPSFFSETYQTPWGAAINFDGRGSGWVRRFFIDNALFWLQEYNFDGLRIDAAHAIVDQSKPDILVELAEAVRQGPGRLRQVHLVLENDNNQARYLRADPKDALLYNAQWNDDIHHVLHLLITGETSGYYRDYEDQPIQHLGRCLSEGFTYQGEASAFRNGKPRGETSKGLPATAFISFLQDHDQVGNRPLAERIALLAPEQAIGAATVLLLLAPQPPLLFMGQEWGAIQPFPFFCDFDPELAQLVSDGRRKGFAYFFGESDIEGSKQGFDPNQAETFRSAVLNWETLGQPEHTRWLRLHKDLLALRRKEIVPLLPGIRPSDQGFTVLAERALQMEWQCGKEGRLTLLANLGEHDILTTVTPPGRLVYAWPGDFEQSLAEGHLPAWSAAWYITGSE